MELQGRVAELASQGISVAAISYDSVETLAGFAADRKITYPLLSDRGSVIIRRYKLLNESVERDSRSFGVPHPGTFMLDASRRVTSRFLEERYQERNTAASIVVRQGGIASGPAATVRNPHMTVTASASDAQVAPGSRITLAFDVIPARNIHVYAPGKHTYEVITPQVDAGLWLSVHETRYPASETYYFAPLSETVSVYQKPFRLTRDVTVGASREAQQALREQKALTVTGKLQYQACDDKLCFSPTAIPFALELQLKPLDRRPQND